MEVNEIMDFILKEFTKKGNSLFKSLERNSKKKIGLLLEKSRGSFIFLSI